MKKSEKYKQYIQDAQVLMEARMAQVLMEAESFGVVIRLDHVPNPGIPAIGGTHPVVRVEASHSTYRRIYEMEEQGE